MKKLYKINLFTSPNKMLRKSRLHQLSFYLRVITSVIGKEKPKKKKVNIDFNTWKYIGGIKKFMPHGKGKILSYGYDFKGTIVDGKANGFGEENNKNVFGLGKYKGEFVNNSRQGKGTFFFYDGLKYIGNWKNNYKNGMGTYIWRDGFKLEGKWNKDFFIGFEKKLTSIENWKKKYPVKSPIIKYNSNSFRYVDFNEKDEK